MTVTLGQVEATIKVTSNTWYIATLDNCIALVVSILFYNCQDVAKY